MDLQNENLKEEIISLYNEINKLYDEVLNNRARINSMLSQFVVNGNQIGSGTFSTGNSDYTSNSDIDLPTDIEAYQQTIYVINDNVNLIDNLINRCKYLIDLCDDQRNIQDRQILEISQKAEELIANLKKMKEEHDEVANQLNEIAKSINNNQGAQEKQQFLNAAGKMNDAGSSGGGGSSEGGGGPSYTPDYDRHDYTKMSSFSGVNDYSSIENSAQNLAEHESNVANILDNVRLNGEAIGGDVYGLDPKENGEDIDVSPLALQLGLDAVDDDIQFTQDLIDQIAEQIEMNEAQIAANEAQITANEQQIESLKDVPPTITECVGHDDEGNPIYEEVENPEYREAQDQITNLTNENIQLAEENTNLKADNEQFKQDKQEYEELKAQKEQVQNDLIALRNELNAANGDMIDLYAAQELCNMVDPNAPTNELFGVEYTNEQIADIFGNMGTKLEENKDNYTLPTEVDETNPGKMDIGKFEALVGACAAFADTFNIKSYGEGMQGLDIPTPGASSDGTTSESTTDPLSAAQSNVETTGQAAQTAREQETAAKDNVTQLQQDAKTAGEQASAAQDTVKEKQGQVDSAKKEAESADKAARDAQEEAAAKEEAAKQARESVTATSEEKKQADEEAKQAAQAAASAQAAAQAAAANVTKLEEEQRQAEQTAQQMQASAAQAAAAVAEAQQNVAERTAERVEAERAAKMAEQEVKKAEREVEKAEAVLRRNEQILEYAKSQEAKNAANPEKPEETKPKTQQELFEEAIEAIGPHDPMFKDYYASFSQEECFALAEKAKKEVDALETKCKETLAEIEKVQEEADTKMYVDDDGIETGDTYLGTYLRGNISEEEYQEYINNATNELQEEYLGYQQNLALFNEMYLSARDVGYEKYELATDFADNCSRIASAEWNYNEHYQGEGTLFPSVDEEGNIGSVVLSSDNPYEQGKYTFKDKDGNILEDVTPLEVAQYFYNNKDEEFITDAWITNFGEQSEAYDTIREVNKYMATFEHLEESEINTLTYLSHTENGERLAEYLDVKSDLSEQRKGAELVKSQYTDKIQQIYDKVGTKIAEYDTVTGKQIGEREYNENDAYLETLGMLGWNSLGDGIKNSFAGIDNLFNADGKRTADEYKNQYLMQFINNAYGETSEFKAGLASSVYELGVNIGNMIPSIAMSAVTGVPFIGTAFMGLSAAGNSTEEALQLGMKKGEAYLYGALCGMSETTLQYFLGGIANLGTGELSEALTKWTGLPEFLTDILSEGIEESTQSILEPLMKSLVTGGRINEGIDWGEVAKSGVLGMISAGLMNTGGLAINGTMYTVNAEAQSILASLNDPITKLNAETIKLMEKIGVITSTGQKATEGAVNINTDELSQNQSTSTQTSTSTDIQALQAKVDAAKANYDSKVAAYNQAVANQQAAQNKVDSINSEIAAMESQIKELESKANTEQSKYEEAKAAADAIAEKKGTANAEYAGLKADADNYKLKADQAQAHAEELGTKLAEAQSNAENANNEFVTAKQNAETLEQDAKAMQTALEEKQAELKQAETTKETLEQSAQEYIDKLAEAEEKAEKATSEREKAEAKENEAKKELEIAKEEQEKQQAAKEAAEAKAKAEQEERENKINNGKEATKDLQMNKDINTTSEYATENTTKINSDNNNSTQTEQQNTKTIPQELKEKWNKVADELNETREQLKTNNTPELQEKEVKLTEQQQELQTELSSMTNETGNQDFLKGQGFNPETNKFDTNIETNGLPSSNVNQPNSTSSQNITPKTTSQSTSQVTAQTTTQATSETVNVNSGTNQSTSSAQTTNTTSDAQTVQATLSAAAAATNVGALVTAGITNITAGMPIGTEGVSTQQTKTTSQSNNSEVSLRSTAAGSETTTGSSSSEKINTDDTRVEKVEKESGSQKTKEVKIDEIKGDNSQTQESNNVDVATQLQEATDIIEESALDDSKQNVEEVTESSDADLTAEDEIVDNETEQKEQTKWQKLLEKLLGKNPTKETFKTRANENVLGFNNSKQNPSVSTNTTSNTQTDTTNNMPKFDSPEAESKYRMNKAEFFFNYDLKVKELISNTSQMGRAEVLNLLEDVDSYFYRMTSGTKFEGIYQIIEGKINNIKDEIINCNPSEFNNIKEKYIYGFTKDAVATLSENLLPYGGSTYNFEAAFENCNSLNEMLHGIHYAAMNMTEYFTDANGKINTIPVFFEGINLLTTGNTTSGSPINVFGVNTDLSNAIFNNLNGKSTAGQTDILSLDNKALLMVRDAGHALTIEVTNLGNNKVEVSYQFPKITNVEKANKVKGIQNVNESSTFATGGFITDIDSIGTEIYDLIESVPTDGDLSINSDLSPEKIVLVPSSNIVQQQNNNRNSSNNNNKNIPSKEQFERIANSNLFGLNNTRSTGPNAQQTTLAINQQIIDSFDSQRTNQRENVQSLINDYLNGKVKNYEQFTKNGVETFDATKVREGLEQKYLGKDGVVISYWGNGYNVFGYPASENFDPRLRNLDWMDVRIGNPNTNSLNNTFKIYVPVNASSFDTTVTSIVDFLVNNGIVSDSKFANIGRADGIIVRVSDYNDAINVINFINSNPNITGNTQNLSLTMPVGKVAVAMDGKLSYNTVATTLMEAYLKNNKGVATPEGFSNFLHDTLTDIKENGNKRLMQELFEQQYDGDFDDTTAKNEYYANVLQIAETLDATMNPNITIDNYLDMLHNNQFEQNIESKIQEVDDILNGRVTPKNNVQMNETNNINPNTNNVPTSTINDTLSNMQQKYGNQLPLTYLSAYTQTGDINYVPAEFRGEVSKLSRSELANYFSQSNMEYVNESAHDFIVRTSVENFLNAMKKEFGVKEGLERAAMYALSGDTRYLPANSSIDTRNVARDNIANYLANSRQNNILKTAQAKLNVQNNANNTNNRVNNPQKAISTSQNQRQVSTPDKGVRTKQMSDLSSFITSFIRGDKNTKIYAQYVRYGIEKFDVLGVRKIIEQRYASNPNVKAYYWNPSNPSYSFMNFDVGKMNDTTFSNSYKIYVPVESTSFNKTVLDVFDFLANNNIASDNKIANSARADAIVLRINDYNDALKVINYINSNPNIPSNVQGIPLAMRMGKVSVAMDGLLSYNSVTTELLQRYINQATGTPSLDGFRSFINDNLDKIKNGDKKTLQDLFYNKFYDSSTDNKRRFNNNINAYYANNLQVMELLKVSLNPNATSSDYFAICQANQVQANIDAQIKAVEQILNNHQLNNSEYNLAILNAIKTMNNKYGDGVARLETYLETGRLDHITRTENARENIAKIPKEYIRDYLQQVEKVDFDKTRKNSHTEENANYSIPRKNMFDTTETQEQTQQEEDPYNKRIGGIEDKMKQKLEEFKEQRRKAKEGTQTTQQTESTTTRETSSTKTGELSEKDLDGVVGGVPYEVGRETYEGSTSSSQETESIETQEQTQQEEDPYNKRIGGIEDKMKQKLEEFKEQRRKAKEGTQATQQTESTANTETSTTKTGELSETDLDGVVGGVPYEVGRETYEGSTSNNQETENIKTQEQTQQEEDPYNKRIGGIEDKMKQKLEEIKERRRKAKEGTQTTQQTETTATTETSTTETNEIGETDLDGVVGGVPYEVGRETYEGSTSNNQETTDMHVNEVSNQNQSEVEVDNQIEKPHVDYDNNKIIVGDTELNYKEVMKILSGNIFDIIKDNNINGASLQEVLTALYDFKQQNPKVAERTYPMMITGLVDYVGTLNPGDVILNLESTLTKISKAPKLVVPSDIVEKYGIDFINQAITDFHNNSFANNSTYTTLLYELADTNPIFLNYLNNFDYGLYILENFDGTNLDMLLNNNETNRIYKIFNAMVQRDFDSFINKILPSLNSENINKYMGIETLAKLNDAKLSQVQSVMPNILDVLSQNTNHIVEYLMNNPFETYSKLMEKFNDFENNRQFFGNMTKGEYINAFMDYLKTDNRLLSNEFNQYHGYLTAYLKMEGLSNKILKDSEIIDSIQQIDNMQMRYLVDGFNSLYESLDTESKLYNGYMYSVLQGQFEIKNYSDFTFYFSKLFSEYNGKITASNEQLLKCLDRKLKMFNEIKNNTFSNVNLKFSKKTLVEHLSIIEYLNSNGVNTDNYLTISEKNSIYNELNAMLLRNINNLDATHLQAHICNYMNHYAKLNNIENLKFEFENNQEKNTGGYASYDGTRIWINTKYFNEQFETSNNFLDLLDTIFHENTHIMQKQEVKLANNAMYTPGNLHGEIYRGAVNKYSLMYEVESLLRKVNESYYKGNNNYQNIIYEVDARYNASLKLFDYIQEIAPDVLTQEVDYWRKGKEVTTTVEEYIKMNLDRDFKMYEQNVTIYEQNGFKYSRDNALESIIRENPSILQERPILNYIFNPNGSRKTIFELYDEINANKDLHMNMRYEFNPDGTKRAIFETTDKGYDNKNVIDMLNYWIENSSYGVDSLIDNLYESYIHEGTNIPSDLQEMIDDLWNSKFEKAIEGISENELLNILHDLDSSRLNDGKTIEDFTQRIIDKYESLKSGQDNGGSSSNNGGSGYMEGIAASDIVDNSQNSNLSEAVNESNPSEIINDNETIFEGGQTTDTNSTDINQDNISPESISNNNHTTEQTNEATDDFEVKNTKDKVTAINNADVIEVSKLGLNNPDKYKIDTSRPKPSPNDSYLGYDYVIKPKASLDAVIDEINNNHLTDNILIEISGIDELSLELLDKIPDNVSIRIHNYNMDYYKTFRKNPKLSTNGTLRNVTYTVSELRQIMTKINEIKAGIDDNWSDYEKAKYIYEYLRDNITYRGRTDGNASRQKQFDGLVNLLEVDSKYQNGKVSESTCQGFAYTYSMLLNSMGIHCEEVWGNLDGTGGHAYNVVKIGNDVFLVDPVRELLGSNYPGTGFGVDIKTIIEHYTNSSNNNLMYEINSQNISDNIEQVDLSIFERKSSNDVDASKDNISINSDEAEATGSSENDIVFHSGKDGKVTKTVNDTKTEKVDNLKTLDNGDKIINQSEVSKGGKAITITKDKQIIFGDKTINANEIIDKFNKGKDSLSENDLHDMIDLMKVINYAKETTTDIGLNISNETLLEMYKHVDKLLLHDYSMNTEYYKEHTANFIKYVAKLNNIDIEVGFLPSDSDDFGVSKKGLIEINEILFDRGYNYNPEYNHIKLLETSFHELFHQIQMQENNLATISMNSQTNHHGIINKYSLMNTIETILTTFNEEYATNPDNYKTLIPEIDARYNAYTMLHSYVSDIAPDLVSEVEERYQKGFNNDSQLYESNNNMYEENNIRLTRDAALENIIKNNPQLLIENPILKFIFNNDGTRKTLFELAEVLKENSHDQNIVNMINYWVKTSNYSIDSLINEMYAAYTHDVSVLPQEFQTIIDNIFDNKIFNNKFTSTLTNETNYFADKDFVSKLEQKLANLNKDNIPEGKSFEEFRDKLLNKYKQTEKHERYRFSNIRNRLNNAFSKSTTNKTNSKNNTSSNDGDITFRSAMPSSETTGNIIDTNIYVDKFVATGYGSTIANATRGRNPIDIPSRFKYTVNMPNGTTKEIIISGNISGENGVGGIKHMVEGIYKSNFKAKETSKLINLLNLAQTKGYNFREQRNNDFSIQIRETIGRYVDLSNLRANDPINFLSTKITNNYFNISGIEEKRLVDSVLAFLNTKNLNTQELRIINDYNAATITKRFNNDSFNWFVKTLLKKSGLFEFSSSSGYTINTSLVDEVTIANYEIDKSLTFVNNYIKNNYKDQAISESEYKSIIKTATIATRIIYSRIIENFALGNYSTGKNMWDGFSPIGLPVYINGGYSNSPTNIFEVEVLSRLETDRYGNTYTTIYHMFDSYQLRNERTNPYASIESQVKYMIKDLIDGNTDFNSFRDYIYNKGTTMSKHEFIDALKNEFISLLIDKNRNSTYYIEDDQLKIAAMRTIENMFSNTGFNNKTNFDAYLEIIHSALKNRTAPDLKAIYAIKNQKTKNSLLATYNSSLIGNIDKEVLVETDATRKAGYNKTISNNTKRIYTNIITIDITSFNLSNYTGLTQDRAKIILEYCKNQILNSYNNNIDSNLDDIQLELTDIIDNDLFYETQSEKDLAFDIMTTILV